MTNSSCMKPPMEEEDLRSIIIRKGYKRLNEYFDILTDTDKCFAIDKLDLFNDIFLSFHNEDDYNTCLLAIKLFFQKVEYYWLEIANCKIAYNIGKLLDCFLTKFKHRLSETEKNNLHEVSNISSDSLKLEDYKSLKDTKYVIALIFLKHYHPVLYKEEENQILARLKINDGIDNCVRKLIEVHLQYPNAELNELIYFQCRSFILIRNTMFITEDYIEKTMNLLEEDFPETWITIYASKMLSHIIVPVIAYKQNKINLDKIQIDDKLLLKWLLEFSNLSFGKKIREDKWETINDEDFALTWQFVKEHASKKQRRDFYKYLIENGFEFHLNDPYSDSCFKDVKTT